MIDPEHLELNEDEEDEERARIEPPPDRPRLKPGAFPSQKKQIGREELLRRLKANWKWVAVAAGVILILLCIAVLLASSAMHNTGSAAAQYASPTVSPNGRFSQPGAGEVPLPTAQDPNAPAQNEYAEFQAWKQCRQTGQCTSQPTGTGGAQETPAQKQAEKMRDLAWAARFTPPDAGHHGDATALPTGSPSEKSLPEPPEKPDAEDAAETHQKNAAQDQYVGPTYLLPGGIAVFTARMITGITAEAAGPVIAQLTQDIYSWNREALLAPKGTYLTGSYERVTDVDQERVQISTDSIMMPDGYRIYFDKPGQVLDQTGEAGVHDIVNHHYLQTFLTEMAISGIGAGASFGGTSAYGFSPVSVLRVGFTQGASQTASQTLRIRKPTLTVRPGVEINVFAPADLTLPEWKNHRVPRI